MASVAIGLFGLQNWFNGDFSQVIDVARRADENGVDQVSLTDHVVMGEHVENYPYGPFPAPLDTPWYEPITVLAAIASSTQKIRLSTGILIAPLRSAVLLAKQLATLDVMSRGRLTIGLGIGWQKEEYDATGIPFEGRYARMDEQVEICKLLWSKAPANYTGKTVNLDKIYQYPRPVQAGGVPIWFGLKPTEKNFARIAKYGDGWIPMENDPEQIAVHAANLRAAFKAAGRDPATIAIRVVPQPVFTNGAGDLDATIATLPALLKAGTTMIEFLPLLFCKGPGDFDAFLTKIVAFRDKNR